MIECANCGKEFKKRTHNNIYCSSECCKEATNKKVIARYHKRKKEFSGERICRTETCNEKLSKYNMDMYCSMCIAKRHTRQMEKVKRIFDGA